MSVIVPDPALTDWVPLGYGAAIQSNVPAVRVRKSAVQSIPNAGGAILTWDVEDYDTDGIHDNATNNTRLTCRTAGKYLVSLTVVFATNTVGTRTAYILKNSSAAEGPVYHGAPNPTGGESTSMSISGILDLAVGDIVEAAAYQVSGIALNALLADGATGNATAFGMVYLGPGLLGRGVQNITGTYLTRPAANAVPPGSTYFAYDALGTWLSDGSQWFLIAQRPAFGAASILGQAPWSTPYDGMEVLITDAFSNPAFMWHFRYNSGSSSAYKWECLGGSPFVNYSSASQAVNVVNTWQNIVSSAITPPRSGEYICQAVVQANHATAGSTAYVSFWAGSVPAGIFGPPMTFGWPVAGGYSGQFTIGPYKATLAAGVGIGVAAQNNQAGGNFSLVQYSLMPTRIS